jgi:hypothetical protein
VPGGVEHQRVLAGDRGQAGRGARPPVGAVVLPQRRAVEQRDPAAVVVERDRGRGPGRGAGGGDRGPRVAVELPGLAVEHHDPGAARVVRGARVRAERGWPGGDAAPARAVVVPGAAGGAVEQHDAAARGVEHHRAERGGRRCARHGRLVPARAVVLPGLGQRLVDELHVLDAAEHDDPTAARVERDRGTEPAGQRRRRRVAPVEGLERAARRAAIAALATHAVVAGLAGRGVDHAVAAALVGQAVGGAAVAADPVAVVARLGPAARVEPDDAIAAAARDARGAAAHAVLDRGVGAGLAVGRAAAVARDARVAQALRADRAGPAGAAPRVLRECRGEATGDDSQRHTANTTSHCA